MNNYLVVISGKKERIFSNDTLLFKSEVVQSDTFEEVEQKIAEKIRDEYGDFLDWDDDGWEEITIYKIESQYAVDTQKYCRAEREAMQREQDKAREKKERAEYERLKKKYEV